MHSRSNVKPTASSLGVMRRSSSTAADKARTCGSLWSAAKRAPARRCASLAANPECRARWNGGATQSQKAWRLWPNSCRGIFRPIVFPNCKIGPLVTRRQIRPDFNCPPSRSSTSFQTILAIFVRKSLRTDLHAAQICPHLPRMFTMPPRKPSLRCEPCRPTPTLFRRLNACGTPTTGCSR